jgi:hypothetical protein
LYEYDYLPWGACLRFKCSSIPELKALDRLPVHELSAVNGQSLRFKYSATATGAECRRTH